MKKGRLTSQVQTKYAILLLILFNTLDGFLTYFGLKLGVIEEANPLLNNFEPFVILVIKLVLSLFLSILFISKFPTRKENVWFVIIVAVNLLYLYIMLLHGTWLYFYLQ